MADKSISDLTAVSTVNSSDSFVLQQNNVAMRLTGQVLLNWLAVALDGHGGINSIAKTGTSGLTDTYTITYADETTSTFTINNGVSIVSIAKTGTSGLTDTYTITYNNNTTTSFQVVNGKGISAVSVSSAGLADNYRMSYTDGTHYDFTITNGRSITSVALTDTDGLEDTYTITYNDSTTSTFVVTNGKGITGIQKSSVVLTDTYRITYSDGSYYDMSVTNGRGISSIIKTGTSGLVDTYTITFNDSTTSAFTVTNGEKGDTGDADYVWIRYSEERPTADADMHTTPDNWMGVYTGTEDTAPTDYTDYVWFQIKGEKGDPGDDITVTSIDVEYQEGESGTTVPTGDWSSIIPLVRQGYFLWTRTVTTFSTGTSSTAYSISRMGIDGAGSVTSVDNIAPDANGNIDLGLTSALGRLGIYIENGKFMTDEDVG